MRKTLLATVIVSLMFGSSVSAQDFTINAPLSNSANLPKQGSATYHGTYELSGVWTGITGDVQVTVDFTTGNVSADLTIPPLGSGNATSPSEHYTPSGIISGKGKHAGYTLTQGVSLSADMPFISMSGTFFGPRALNTLGTFDANFCVPEPDCSSPFVVRSVTGTFSATRGSPPS
jgi:hypothetical protein